MRPVQKKDVGEEIELVTREKVKIKDPTKNHRDSHSMLVANLGSYCSYCECAVKNYDNLQVEHVQPQGYKENGVEKYAHLKLKWSNFLLSCSNCNGRSNKSSKDVVIGNIHLPHLNNTFLSIEYRAAGVVVPNPRLANKSLDNAQNLIDTLGFEKDDARREMRREMWEKAVEFLDDYRNNVIKLKYLIDYIKVCGCWSIWFTIFKGHDDVRKALIDEFPGTAANCFDPNNHYEPLPRNPQNITDPV